MTNNAYIHIPFCKSKCKYCSFVSYCKDNETIERYVKVLNYDIKYNYAGEPINTLYMGGGTPSLLTQKQILSIIKNFNLQEDCEITIEINPDTVDETYLKELKSIGINRISMGVQTFDDKILKIIGRTHSSKQAFQTLESLNNAGFNNVSIDFIYGLPEQSISNFKQDLTKAKALGLKHISLYGLKIDENCIWEKNPPENLPNNDIQADMYLTAIETLGEYNRYEISNFSLAGYESKHNLNYWSNNSYYGFGAAAHGYVDGVRYFNASNLEEYMTNPCTHKEGHFVTQKEMLEEEIFLGFRKSNGIDINSINKKYSINFESKYSDTLKKYMPDYIAKTPNGYKLTTEGVLLSNLILSEFLD